MQVIEFQMDKIKRTNDDDSLFAELSTIINKSDLKLQTCTSVGQTFVPHNDAAKEEKRLQYSIEEQIFHLRRQLSQSYNLFTGARDTLAGISFVKLENQIQSSTVPIDSEKIPETASFGNVNELSDEIRLAKKLFAASKRTTKNPELNTFFHVVAQLQNGIKDMETNHTVMTALKDRVADALEVDKEYVEGIMTRLASCSVSNEAFCRAEQQLADLENE